MPKGLDHLLNNLPSLQQVLYYGLPLLLYTIVAAGIAGWLKSKHNWRTPYTRKVFHFLILSAASVIHVFGGLSLVILFGSIVSLVVLATIIKGSGFIFYEALARETDRPHRSKFVLIPLITTALGGVLANILFPAYAFVGYMVCAWGDAAGEPIGTRWGKHKYKVPGLFGVPATRSLEGSAGVLVTSFVAAAFALAFLDFSLIQVLLAATVTAIFSAIVEAVSNHGLDNFTIQLAGAGGAWLVLEKLV